MKPLSPISYTYSNKNITRGIKQSEIQTKDGSHKNVEVQQVSSTRVISSSLLLASSLSINLLYEVRSKLGKDFRAYC